MRAFKETYKRNRTALLLWVVFSGTGLAVTALYNIVFEPVVYSIAVSFAVMAVAFTIDYFIQRKRMDERENCIASINVSRLNLPEPQSALEEDYSKMIGLLGETIDRLVGEYEEERRDSLDYYTAWVHQIKTPIAVMKLKLSDDTPENFSLKTELFRIEQYVDMVLQYIRLGSRSTDLLIKEYDLDELIKETVRKYATQFVEKHIGLDFVPTERSVLTDRKWFVLILEQFVSNAIKYTPSGTITIKAEGDRLLISDTGIGIAKEDLPRIFEKGFTGNNGRIGEKSSGLGLYLVKKTADLLNIGVDVESTIGKGTDFFIDIKRKEVVH